ncbi:MAG: hypothetical protein CSA81_01820 [Acidobacteria bacterium]|nr:MAG: hypothetical protein CSA81_01820 [Acidobacteriota bacterium]
MSKTNKRTLLPLVAWEDYVENWKNSHLTLTKAAAAYYLQKNLVYFQFIYWSSKLKTQEASPMLVAIPYDPFLLRQLKYPRKNCTFFFIELICFYLLEQILCQFIFPFHFVNHAAFG